MSPVLKNEKGSITVVDDDGAVLFGPVFSYTAVGNWCRENDVKLSRPLSEGYSYGPDLST